MSRILRSVIAGIVLSLSAISCAMAGQSVVVTLPVFGLLVTQLSADAAVTVLVKGHEDAHHVALTPKERLALSRADLIVRAGAIEGGMDHVLSSTALRDRVLRLDQVVAGQEGWNEEFAAAPGQQHFWLDPSLIRHVTAALADGLDLPLRDEVALDLVQLDQQITDALAPYAGRGVVTLHDGLGRFLKRYGLVVLADETHEHEAGMSAADMGHMRHALIDHPGSCLVASYEVPENTLKVLMAGTGATKETTAVRFDFVGARYDSYRHMMISLTDDLVRCFSPDGP